MAKRLHNDGLRVWFDEWLIHPGDDIFLKIEDGLQQSRTLVLVMSSNTFGSNWVRLERSTSLFRDPTNEKRRFIPLLIQDCIIPEAIQRYKYIDWCDGSEDQYYELVRACRPSQPQPKTLQAPRLAFLEGKLIGHSARVYSIALSPDGNRALSAAVDGSLKLWDLLSGSCQATLIGHKEAVYSVAILPDGKRALSCSNDQIVRLWNLDTKECIRTFEAKEIILSLAIIAGGKQVLLASMSGKIQLLDIASLHPIKLLVERVSGLFTMAVTPDGKQVLSGSSTGTLFITDIHSGVRIAESQEHTSQILAIAVTPDGKQALSSSSDHTVKLWNIELAKCLATFEGHLGTIRGLAISPDGKLGASASYDDTIRLWELKTGICLDTIEGEADFNCITFSKDGSYLLAGSDDGCIYVYGLTGIEHITSVARASIGVRYTNAKVVLIGESGIGKSGLAHRLAEDRWIITESTHGMKVWPLDLPRSEQGIDMEREVWLWDLAGQPEYRLVHQLFLDETAVALVVFNPQADDPFVGIGDWENALRVAIGRDPVKLLIAARIDRGGATLTRDKIEQYCHGHGFSEYFATSAKQNEGCSELKQALMRFIPWEQLSWISTTRLFKALKDAIIQLKDEGIVLVRIPELRQRLQFLLPNENIKEQDLRVVVGLLAGQGVVKRLDFGNFILLQPEQLNNYATAVIRSARRQVDGIGCIRERDVLDGAFDFKDMPRLDIADEEILLPALVQTFIDQSLCIREDTPSGVQLVFPSQFNREIEISAYPNAYVTYRFSGHLPTVYTTLVVRLIYSGGFERKDLWKNAAEFLTPQGKTVSLIMTKIDDGVGEIKIYFDTEISDDTRIIFIRYVHEHLLKRAVDVERERDYTCPNCKHAVENRKAIRARLQLGKKDIGCDYCDERIPLLDLLDQKSKEGRFLKRVEQLDAQAGINIDNESKEVVVVGHAYAVSAEAGQIYRQYTNSEQGIDGEIEFRDNEGNASGRKIYVQMRLRESYTYQRQRNGKEIFTMKNSYHSVYWHQHNYIVYLIVRNPDGVIRWMNVTEYLRNQSGEGSKYIFFEGEPFTATILTNLRDKYIPISY